MSETFKCRVCGVGLMDDNWYPSYKLEKMCICNGCADAQKRARRPASWKKQRRASRPMNKNKQCTLFLGVNVAERVLSKVFKGVERMPIFNPGYDFICNHGKKIDVKASCLNKDKRWKFKIDRNQIPDFFLMVAFNNRRNLDPMHVWLIPKENVCSAHSVSISPSTINKWNDHKLDIEKVVACCEDMRS